ncbi:MAG: hypothetical protein ACREBE_00065 [bacterium]
MSELAFNEHGQRIAVLDDVKEWRVRLFKNPDKPGTCSVVYGEDSLPLHLDVHTTAEEFREAVGHRPGKYRLDGVDAQGNPVPGMPPVYLVINGPASVATGASTGSAYSAPPAASTPLEYAVVELARANRDAVTSMADRFSDVCNAIANVVRAVDAAGLPRREPLGPLLVDHVDESDEESERNAAATAAPQPTAMTMFAQVIQMVQGFMQMAGAGNPAKMGAVMGQVVETAKVVEAVSLPVSASTEDEPTSDGDALRAATSAPVNGANGASVAHGTHASHGAPVANAAQRAARARPSAPVAASASANGPTATSPGAAVDPTAQFQQIMAALNPEEQVQVQYVMRTLTMGDLLQWYEQLANMPVSEGVAKIRAELARVPTEKAA